MELNKIYQGDCLEVMKTLPTNSVDAVVTDPPYGLSFMGKKWDYDVPSQEIWQECLRVLKPGGYLLAFAGTRTQHRMAVRIEDAGFEIRDMIAWVYGSGFPKSLNIGKAIDKINGCEMESLPTLPMKEATEVGAISKNRRCAICGKAISSGNPCQCDRTYKAQNEWSGWGTALKPALEPITVARKPLSEKTVADNVLKYGTGGINIDECRVGTDEHRSRDNSKCKPDEFFSGKQRINQVIDNSGRFPANFIHDGSEEVINLFPNSKGGAYPAIRGKSDIGAFGSGGTHKDKPNQARTMGDDGSAARFFYCAKASKSERNKGLDNFDEQIVNDGREKDIDNDFQRGTTLRKNTHPTVKPIALMEYLVKLVSRDNSIVLDPFTGSGSTGIACKNLNRNFIGCELDGEYCKIAAERVGCEIIKPDYIKVDKDTFKDLKFEIEIKVKPEMVIDKTICPECGGKIKGKYCEDCLKEY